MGSVSHHVITQVFRPPVAPVGRVGVASAEQGAQENFEVVASGVRSPQPLPHQYPVLFGGREKSRHSVMFTTRLFRGDAAFYPAIHHFLEHHFPADEKKTLIFYAGSTMALPYSYGLMLDPEHYTIIGTDPDSEVMEQVRNRQIKILDDHWSDIYQWLEPENANALFTPSAPATIYGTSSPHYYTVEEPLASRVLTDATAIEEEVGFSVHPDIRSLLFDQDTQFPPHTVIHYTTAWYQLAYDIGHKDHPPQGTLKHRLKHYMAKKYGDTIQSDEDLKEWMATEVIQALYHKLPSGGVLIPQLYFETMNKTSFTKLVQKLSEAGFIQQAESGPLSVVFVKP